uniref:Uncharacterized protein n=1 Tax=Xiphophorus couchianus TaxID=32473 RepID=A0A3B5MZJ1_9TELE
CMAQQDDSWSSCKRPAEVVRLRRKRARSVAESPGPSGSSPASGLSSATPSLHSQSTSRGKRRNPFLTWDNTVSRPKKVLVEDCENVCTFIKLMSNPLTITPVSIAPVSCAEYPADWSLKTRVIFTSPASLSWTGQPKAQEEALGLSNSCRAKFTMLPHNLQEPRSWSDVRSAFQQSLVYWQHPSLPWLSLFPRINAEKNFSGKNMPWTQDEALFSLLRSVSLSSLYSLLKVGLCPYFYVCSYQFTVLFKAAGLAGSDCITALISPTTRGLREAMKAEGVEFSLPLLKERRRISEQHKNDGYSQGEDDSLSWLKEIGIQDKLRQPECINIQLQKEAPTLSLDHKPESAVCVEGSNSFNLINFLINWKSVVAAAGSQTGLPPTLLAPTAFRGATMNVLKAVGDLTHCGLPPASINHLQQPSTLGKATLTHITMNNYNYTWKIG